MKRIRPATRYDSADGYPSVRDTRLDRRGFLRATLVGSATVGGSLLLSGESAARKAPRYHQVKLRLRGRYVYQPCRYRAEQVLIQTRDVRLARFAGNAKERAGIEAALAGVLRAATCADLQDRKRLARLHAKLARALARHYTSRTRRKVTVPIVTLGLRRHYRPLPGTPPPPRHP